MIKTYKSGFTFLELIISITILIFIFSLGFKGVHIAKMTINSIRANAAISELAQFLSFGKLYCKKNNTSVIIYLKSTGNAEFTDTKNHYCKKITLPKGFKFVSNYNVNCSNLGALSSDSIYIADEYGEFYKLTISVGVDNINIYYGE